MSDKKKINFEKFCFNRVNYEIKKNKSMKEKSRLKVKFSPIVKVINVESYKEYNKKCMNKNLNLF